MGPIMDLTTARKGLSVAQEEQEDEAPQPKRGQKKKPKKHFKAGKSSTKFEPY